VSLLSLAHVSKRYRRGARDHLALDDVSMTIEQGELLAILGTRRSGRSTLLRIAAGLERPDQGTVSFEGAPLASVRDIVGHHVCYCHASFSPMEGERVVDHVAAPLLAHRQSLRRARRAAESALARAGAAECGSLQPDGLTAAEAMRVGIARALVAEPSLLVVDDPTAGVGSLHADGILRLLRSIADDRIAVLMSTDDATCISGADRALALDRGKLSVEEAAPAAEVVPLRPRKLDVEPGAHRA
jgi:ABC-type ATPase involved in cell division